MQTNDIETIFDYTVSLQEGQEIAIPFNTRNKAEAARVALYRQKAKYKRTTGEDAEFMISTNYSGEKFLLILKKLPRLKHIYLMQDGKPVKAMTIEEMRAVSPENLLDEMEKETRYIKVQELIEDGVDCEWSDELFEEHRAERFPEYSSEEWQRMINERRKENES